MESNFKKVTKMLGLMCMFWVGTAMLLVSLPGCNKPTPSTVQTLTSVAVDIGFTAWKAKNPTQEAAVSALIAQGVADALAYVQGNQGVATSVLEAAMMAKLTAKLPPEIVAIIVAAAGVLDEVLPVPSPTTYLTPDQIAYLTAFLQGVKDGISSVNATKDVTDKATKLIKKDRKQGGWLTKR